MGQSTNGQICFGVAFPDGFEFPWDTNRQYDGDIEEWWKHLKGFTPLFEMWGKDNNYKDGKEPTKDEKDKYYEHQRKWKEANPIPIEMANYCSGDYPMYMIAVPSSFKKNYRGDPTVFDPAKLAVTPEEVRVLKEFIEKYVDVESIDSENFDPEPKWYLSSYWGG